MRDRTVRHRPLAGRLLLAFALLGAVTASPARAHRQETPSALPEAGISIPDLSHGQLTVIAANRAAILDLAARQTPTDRVMRRLETFINLQFSACAWGLVPGSLADEDSPFNECTHAYLAATQALLLHLREMPGDRAPVRRLAAAIELEMLEKQASLVLCRYSGESFNTAEVVRPNWGDVIFHPAHLLGFLSLALTAAAGGSMAARWRSVRGVGERSK